MNHRSTDERISKESRQKSSQQQQKQQKRRRIRSINQISDIHELNSTWWNWVGEGRGLVGEESKAFGGDICFHCRRGFSPSFSVSFLSAIPPLPGRPPSHPLPPAAARCRPLPPDRLVVALSDHVTRLLLLLLLLFRRLPLLRNQRNWIIIHLFVCAIYLINRHLTAVNDRLLRFIQFLHVSWLPKEKFFPDSWDFGGRISQILPSGWLAGAFSTERARVGGRKRRGPVRIDSASSRAARNLTKTWQLASLVIGLVDDRSEPVAASSPI